LGNEAATDESNMYPSARIRLSIFWFFIMFILIKSLTSKRDCPVAFYLSIVVGLFFSRTLQADSQFGCGADISFVSYEAEKNESNASVVNMNKLPGPNEASPEIKASGRSYVKLTHVGDYCEIMNARAGNAIVLRYSIPDAVAPGDITEFCG
jgi:hypothetical protein